MLVPPFNRTALTSEAEPSSTLQPEMPTTSVPWLETSNQSAPIELLPLEQFAALAKSRGYAGVICGHLHPPADKLIAGMHYRNASDWVESMTGIIAHFDGRVELICFEESSARFPRGPQIALLNDLEASVSELPHA